MKMKVIGRIRSDFPTKFGIPRQSGLVQVPARIVMEPEYRSPDGFRGLEEYSHIWLLWEFSEAKRNKNSLTVRPPRLGGNRRVGVFASRSPFRPNPIGLSCVELVKIENEPGKGPVLYVRGADILDGTPIYDIKPYLAYTDSRTEARGGYAEQHFAHRLRVVCTEEICRQVPAKRWEEIEGLLAQDPRPSYQTDPERIYGMEYGEWEIRFRVEGDVLTVCQATKLSNHRGLSNDTERT